MKNNQRPPTLHHPASYQVGQRTPERATDTKKERQFRDVDA